MNTDMKIKSKKSSLSPLILSPLTIAHDYEGVNLSIIENVIREKLPKLKTTINSILKKED